MAINISHLLKEESYLQYVQDPLSGSFQIEKITAEIIEKAWGLFNQLNDLGGILEEKAANKLREEIQQTKELRVERLKSKSDILIGINQFDNPEKLEVEWMDLPNYFHLEALILEKTV